MAKHILKSVEEAVKELKLDRRHKWHEFMGELIYDYKFTAPCTGCSCDCSYGYGCNHENAGCSECGYTGKRVGYAPVPALSKNGKIVKILTPKL